MRHRLRVDSYFVHSSPSLPPSQACYDAVDSSGDLRGLGSVRLYDVPSTPVGGWIVHINTR